MTPFTVKREDGHFSGLERAFPSAGAVRRALFESGHLPEGALPGATERVLAAEREEGRFPVDGRVLDRAVIASLRKLTPGELSEMAEVSEGLENRILAAAKSAASVAELVNAVKTRRYTEARIRRIIMSAFLCIDRTLQNGNVLSQIARHIRAGAGTLSQMKERATLPVITKPATLPKDNPTPPPKGADDLYALPTVKTPRRRFDRSSPVIAAKITDFGMLLDMADYAYKIETHCHTIEVSCCSHIGGRELARPAGYGAINITDHFRPDRIRPDKQRKTDRLVLSGYRAAQAEAIR